MIYNIEQLAHQYFKKAEYDEKLAMREKHLGEAGKKWATQRSK